MTKKIKWAYYGDDCRVNNYIGSQSLLENVKSISKAVKINKLIQEDKKRLFYNLSEVISKQRQDTIWNLIWRRYTNVRNLHRIEER